MTSVEGDLHKVGIELKDARRAAREKTNDVVAWRRAEINEAEAMKGLKDECAMQAAELEQANASASASESQLRQGCMSVKEEEDNREFMMERIHKNGLLGADKGRAYGEVRRLSAIIEDLVHAPGPKQEASSPSDNRCKKKCEEAERMRQEADAARINELNRSIEAQMMINESQSQNIRMLKEKIETMESEKAYVSRDRTNQRAAKRGAKKRKRKSRD